MKLGRTVTPATLPLQALQPQTASLQIDILVCFLTTSSILQPTRAAHNQPPIPPQTPGRVAANHLLTRLNTQTLMASPGPPLRNQSDDESEQDDEDFVGINISHTAS